MPQCYRSTAIAVPIELVWETFQIVHDFSWASEIIERREVVGNICHQIVAALLKTLAQRLEAA